MYAAVGFGILTKGPVAALLPAAAIVIYLALYRRIGEVKNMMLPAGVLIVLAIVTPWYLAVYFEHGWHYIRTFLLDDNLSRYTQPVWGPRRSIFFYLGVVAGDFFPWSVLLPSAIWALTAGFRRSGATSGNAEPDGKPVDHNTQPALGNLMLISIAVVVGFYSLSSNKEDLYVLPVYTAAAALVGGFLFPDREQRRSTLLSASLIAVGVILAGFGAVLLWAIPKLSSAYTLAGVEPIGYVAACGGFAAAVICGFTGRRRAILPLTLLTITLVAINWIFVLKTLPDFEKYKPVPPLCEVISEHASPDAKVGYYRFASPSMVFYLQRPIFEYYRPEQLIDLLVSEKEVYCVMTALDYESLRGALPVRTIVLATRPTFQVKLKGLLSATESPQVVLISNKLGARNPE
jgi:4-amino-4-deoxy-L-arabinose transferase-like glycosyltransferase